MKVQTTMIRFHRHKVDQLREKVAGLETMQVELLARRDQLDETLERERIRSNDSDIGRLAFPTFQKSVHDRQANLQRSADEIAGQVADARAALEKAFEEFRASGGDIDDTDPSADVVDPSMMIGVASRSAV